MQILIATLQHLRGAISKPDFQEFLVHAGRVGELTLSRYCDNSNNSLKIAPGTFVRLCQLQNRDSPGPLLPALKRLRLDNPDEWSMSQLPLFFTRSLRSLDVMNFPENQQSVLLSFLITLVDEAPHLATITFGPGILTTACFEACLNFLFLRQLELKEVNTSIDFNLLTAIGQLRELDTLVLDDRGGCYREDSQEPPIRSVGFICLKKLHITGTLTLIRLLCNAVGSAALEDLGLTLVRSAPPPRTQGKKKSKKVSATGVTEVDSITKDICDLLQEGSWRHTLKSIYLNHFQDYPDVDSLGPQIPPKPVDLPVMILDHLLEHTKLEDLEIEGWTLPEAASGHELLFSDTSNLKTIRLPVGSTASTIHLADLPSIAKSHPDLISLQCGIKSLSNFTSPPLSIEMPSHGLKILSVGSSSEAADAIIDWKQKLSIAAFLDTLFPNLERIETHFPKVERIETSFSTFGQIETRAEANPSEQWGCIYDLVKMCQTSRLIHANRRHSASESSTAGDGK